MRKLLIILIAIAVIVISAVVVGFDFREAIAGVIKIITTGSATITVKSPNNNGLVGFWNFDDCDTCTTAKDYSGQGNEGTITDANASGLKNRLAGKINNALNFDGTDDYVIADIDGTSLTQFSVDLWVKPSGAQSGVGVFQWAHILSTGIPLVLLRRNDSTSVVWYVNNVYRPSIPASDNAWTHLAVTHDGTTWRFYANGVLTDSYIGGRANQENANSIYLGNGYNGYYKGLIDEVRIYNRALSAAEIQTLYEGTRRIYVNTSQNSSFADGLVGMWSFNGPDMNWALSTAEARDSSGSGNHGDVTNFGQSAVIPGIVGQALTFDGTDDDVNVADSDSLSFGNSITDTPLTFAAWVKMNDATGFTILNKTVDATSREYQVLNVNAAYSTVGERFSLGLFDNIGDVDIRAVSNTDLTSYENQWIHLAATYNGNGSASGITLYLNGAVLPSTTGSDGVYVAMHNQISPMKIGHLDLGATDFWAKGLIDEVRVYNRALSASEVNELYRIGRRE